MTEANESSDPGKDNRSSPPQRDSQSPSRGRSPTPSNHSSNSLRADAVADNGVLSLLSVPGHRRSMSLDTRTQLATQLQQQRYSEHRETLQRLLAELAELLADMKEFAHTNSVVLPEQQLRVLQIDLRLGAGSVGPSVVGKSTGSLLESRLVQTIGHIGKLQDRIADTTSHVLVTGDLNAGKSSLCNALLRKPVLPVDQQPCTDVFCEVIDAAKNDNREEVHAVLLDKTYAHENPETFRTFSLADLDDLVHEVSTYKLLKVYVKDERPPERSLLANGTVDICLIDAPGLNVDVARTEELFGRQEEIDLVIFVVSAENHLTQSSKEFVADTAREKSLVFMVVNSYDRIRDKQRCQDRILKQVADLVPETHKGSGDFVHFVSSEGKYGPDGSDGPDNGGDPHGPGSPDFDRLEASLRQFVLEKRSLSKLAPARTYLAKTLGDVEAVAAANRAASSSQAEEFEAKLAELSPELDGTIADCASVAEKIDKDVDRLTRTLYNQSREYLVSVVDNVGDVPLVAYPGLFDVWQYATLTREALISRIQDAVVESEENARELTATAVDAIKSLGILHVGDKPAFSKVFQKSAMFSRRRDNLARALKADLSFSDFFDFGMLLERPLPVLNASKQALITSASPVNSALALFSVVGGGQLALSSSLVRSVDWGTVKQLWLPIVAVVSAGVAAYVVHELPRTLPRKIARKIALEIDDMGYVHANADRIAGESRKVLKYPARDVRAAFQTKIESASRERQQFEQHAHDALVSAEFFEAVQTRGGKILGEVQELNLS